MAEALLVAHHLPGRTLQLAKAAERDQGPHRFVLQRVGQLAANAVTQIDQAVAGGAGDALAGRELHLHRRAAVRAGELAGAAFLLAGRRQSGQLQLLEPHRPAARQCRRLRSIVDAQHFAIGAAKFHHCERLAERRQPGQLALRRDQHHLLVGSDAEALAGDGSGRADPEPVRRRHLPRVAIRHGEHIGTVVLGQAGQARVVEQGVPLGPDASGAAVLQPSYEGEATAVPAARRHQLQRAVVVE
jgi:hypothetical protein